MVIQKSVTAGTLESSDVMITLEPGNSIEIEVESTVGSIFGDSIRQCILDTLKAFDVTGAKVIAKDRGAISSVMSARVEGAIRRAVKEGEKA